MVKRLLTSFEINLLSNLISNVKVPFNHIDDLNKKFILLLTDGQMGSFELISEKTKRQFGKAIIEATTLDIDGRKVFLELSIDTEGDLYQLDVFTEDFNPLKGVLGETGALFDIFSPPLIKQ